MPDDITREARELCERATPGPWEYSPGGFIFPHSLPLRSLAFVTGSGNQAADAAFIARSRTLIPELLDLLAAKDAEIARLRADRQRYADVHARSLSLRRKHEYTIQCLTAERDTAVDERDTLMLRHSMQVEVIRRRIDAGGLTAEEQQLLDDLMLPRHYDRRGATNN